MIDLAVSMLVLLIAPAWSLLAVSVMLVPPARSMPSLGVVWPERNIPPVSATMASRITASARPGYPWLPEGLRPLFGAATFSILPVQPPCDLRAAGRHDE